MVDRLMKSRNQLTLCKWFFFKVNVQLNHFRDLSSKGTDRLPLCTKAKQNLTGPAEHWSCVKVEAAMLGSLSLIVLMVFVDVKQH